MKRPLSPQHDLDLHSSVLRRIVRRVTPQLASHEAILADTGNLVQEFLRSREDCSEVNGKGNDGECKVGVSRNSNTDREEEEETLEIARGVRMVANEFQTIATETPPKKGLGRKHARNQLEAAAKHFTNNNCHAVVGILSISLVLASLTIVDSVEDDNPTRATSSDNSGKRAAASAISSAVLRQGWNNLSESKTIVATVVHALLCTLEEHASRARDVFDLHVLATLARSFGITTHQDEALSQVTGRVIARLLLLEEHDNYDDDASLNSNAIDTNAEKLCVASAMTLAAQLGPWSHLSAAVIIQEGISYDLWHGAERVVESVIEWQTVDQKRETMTQEAVLALIDLAMESKRYRNADKFATEFFQHGGASRYLDARFYHACDSIAKLVRKKVLPIIERQVERVDAACVKLNITDCDKPSEIRLFALTQLGEVGEVDAAKRLADLWNMEHEFDEETIAAAVQARKKKYLQWEEALPDRAIPELVSTPDDLHRSFTQLGLDSGKMEGLFGFDAEWADDESKGVALLQLATRRAAILIDIPALSSSNEGTDALKQTVGKLFASKTSRKVGFACRQDITRLRSSPCAYKEHWLDTTESVVDMQPMIGKATSQLRRLGLSRACEVFLGKPLDKSEQCSSWSSRPLSEQQRIYAALDAWACAALHDKVVMSKTGG